MTLLSKQQNIIFYKYFLNQIITLILSEMSHLYFGNTSSPFKINIIIIIIREES